MSDVILSIQEINIKLTDSINSQSLSDYFEGTAWGIIITLFRHSLINNEQFDYVEGCIRSKKLIDIDQFKSLVE